MNMNDRDWEDNDFWDQGPEDEDEDEFNDIASDVDANNDETFANAAEWNEDEHEEMIARDSILSQTRQRTNNLNSSNNNNVHATNSNNNNNGLNRNRPIGDGRGPIDLLADGPEHRGLVASILGSAGPSSWTSNENNFPLLDKRDFTQSGQMPVNSDVPWQSTISGADRLRLIQLQQQQLLLQAEIQDQEHMRQQQQIREREMLQQQQQQREQNQQTLFNQATRERQILRVDDLERQLRKTSINQGVNTLVEAQAETSRRAGWSPFGSKDLFNTPEGTIRQGGNIDLGTPSMALEQQYRFLIQEQQILQQQLQQLTMMKQQQEFKQQRQQQQQRLLESRLIPPNPKCFTVEELERQMMAGNKSQSTESQGAAEAKRRQPEITNTCFLATIEAPLESARLNERHRNVPGAHDRRNGERPDRFERYHRDVMDSSRDHRERGEHRHNREHQHGHQNSKREPKIIPPQVQLSVIDKTQHLHSIPEMHKDEFLQDRMPTSSDGFHLKKHSKMANERVNHDGVLTEKERNWLIKIQEKIQADYDDNLDQDYYYLLYFNRSSAMTDEAAQKPCGPGVLDRRFIPRERLLYNSGV